MLKGFSVPLTPQGKSALATLPPWHYSSDCVAIEFWADRSAVAAVLPPGLAVDESSAGRGFFWFLDWQFTGSNDELTDPARYQYREAFLLVEAVFEGKPVNYCPYIFVDNDAAIARGWAQGFPKKHASVYQNPKLFRAQSGGRSACQRKPVRRQRGRPWRKTCDGPHPARGIGAGSVDRVQSADNDAPIFSSAHGRPSGQARGRRAHHVADGRSRDRRRVGGVGRAEDPRSGR